MSYDRTSPTAAETYFNHSIFGQLYTLIAEALSRGAVREYAPIRGAAGRSRTQPAPSARFEESTSLLERLEAWFWRQQQAAQETYLAGSRDVFDLERRIEALERGTQTRYY